MHRLMPVVAAIGLTLSLGLCLAASAQGTHPRPKAAHPLRFSLVPPYAPCTAPNRTHGPPLAFPSCDPPVPLSAHTTVGTPDANGAPANFVGHLLIRAYIGFPNPPDENDMIITAPLRDVRCVPASTSACGAANAIGPPDYTGELRLTFTFRQTDHFNAIAPGGGTDPATVEDITLEIPWWPCTETASTSTGGSCDMGTTVNAVYPGALKDTKRLIGEIDDIRMWSGGADGESDTTADNSLLAVPGIFIP